MDKKALHSFWLKFWAVKPWYFLLAFIICAGLSVYELRQNNLTMVQLRNAVYVADKNDINVNGALKNLQAYVTAHMNTDLSGGPNAAYPPIQLQYTYQRLQKAEAQQVDATNQPLYTEAENYCQQQIPTGFSGRYRVACIDQYVTSHGAKITPIPAGLYEFNFLSPSWSPDLAGWALLLSAVLLLTSIVTWILYWIRRRAAHQ